MKILILLLALITAPMMAFCSDEASYQAIKYGDVITDDGDVICDGDGDADCESDDCSCDDDDN